MIILTEKDESGLPPEILKLARDIAEPPLADREEIALLVDHKRKTGAGKEKSKIAYHRIISYFSGWSSQERLEEGISRK